MSKNLRKIKINDMKTVIFFTTFKVIYVGVKRIPLKLNTNTNLYF